MKRISHFFIVLIGICTALVLGYIFTVIYTEVGNALLVHDSKTITLYKVLTEINFSSIAVAFGMAFGMAFAYMLLLDLLTVLAIHSWHRVQNKKKSKYQSKIAHFWFRYRTIHLTFILLSVFITLSLTATAMIMNSFTAIVSISVLISNLTKKIGND
ncbi:hypothetical protein [Lactococcus cremoris]|uniref:hypothetical protein n=1 Tax=Lactococcus lactis subsp. cremoris TaxID=1359 RepID=UPI00196513B8|nr:hypothetical protein [Lactococcus cremoris]QRZ32427.1 hypothetical protein LLW34_1278 [Lactococcus cremoris]